MNKTYNKILLSLGLCLSSTVSLADTSQWVEWIADGQVGIQYVDNLNLSAFDNDAQSDKRLTLDLEFGRFYQFSGQTRAMLSASIAAEQYDKFDKMDNYSLGAKVGLRHKFGVGLQQPYLQVNAVFDQHQFDADLWQHKRYQAGLELGQPLSTRLNLAAAIKVTSMQGKKGPTIDASLRKDPLEQVFWHGSILLDYQLSQDWLLSLDYSRREGDFHSACTVENVATVLEQEKVDAITADEIFGGCFYRLDGSADIVSVSISYALSHHASINLSTSHYQGDADVLNYKGNTTGLNYIYRY